MESTTGQFQFKTAKEVANSLIIEDRFNTRDVLWQFILAFFTVNHCAPFMSEMGRAIDIIQHKLIGSTSKATIKFQLDKLEEEGKIATWKENGARQHGRIYVVGSKWLRPGWTS